MTFSLLNLSAPGVEVDKLHRHGLFALRLTSMSTSNYMGFAK